MTEDNKIKVRLFSQATSVEEYLLLSKEQYRLLFWLEENGWLDMDAVVNKITYEPFYKEI